MLDDFIKSVFIIPPDMNKKDVSNGPAQDIPQPKTDSKNADKSNHTKNNDGGYIWVI